VNIGVMGAGAVGCYYGALLAKAGHRVTLVGRQAFVDRVAVDGLRLDTGGLSESVQVIASTDASALADADVVLLSVKSADTQKAGYALAPHLKPDAVVFTFQNGVDNAERLEIVLKRPVIPAVVYVATEMVGPGHVKHNGRGEIIIGPSPQSASIAMTFAAAGIPATVSDHVKEALWGKLIINCAYNALSAVSQMPYGPMTKVDGVSEVMTDLVLECVAVARACGVAVPDPDLETVFGIARAMPNQFSSTAQDMAQQKPTEIDYLNGYVVRKGREFGIPTPANRALHVMVKLLESKRFGIPD
jgi:2-dehydropantoate 2-reductase